QKHYRAVINDEPDQRTSGGLRAPLFLRVLGADRMCENDLCEHGLALTY
ncbi:MAG: hypothetical protein ACJAYH_002673, partial [Celeribacter sp.]